jgi:HlyD family secretion protein
MQKALLILLLIVVCGAAVSLTWWLTHRATGNSQITLYGNIDLRQIDLAFNNSERIAKVLVQEGDHVHAGQVVAVLETSRIEPQVAEAEGQVASQREVVRRMHNGSRPEEIAQARANVESAKADAANAKRTYDRLTRLAKESNSRAVSQQDMEKEEASLDVANAKLVMAQKSLDLSLAGPRQEDVAQAEAQFRAEEARLALLRQQLKDAQLIAPANAIVRTRLMEPGEMASPQKSVFSLAIVDPKWVRAYVSETDLGKVHPGTRASIASDSFPDRRFEGWVGFISPVAEFTPKAVETPELRTSLVYEVRVFVKDPDDDLRLGMPTTVYLSPDQSIAATQPTARSAQ